MNAQGLNENLSSFGFNELNNDNSSITLSSRAIKEDVFGDSKNNSKNGVH
ncbi:hypothetical protein NW066_01040 [Mycoplasmopsis felis]|nr:hypothetical protein [Mycoplasmopsis felis]UWV85308.1 hypothetical protein NW066_01040 [Mycoplasmopsis felis]